MASASGKNVIPHVCVPARMSKRCTSINVERSRALTRQIVRTCVQNECAPEQGRAIGLPAPSAVNGSQQIEHEQASWTACKRRDAILHWHKQAKAKSPRATQHDRGFESPQATHTLAKAKSPRATQRHGRGFGFASRVTRVATTPREPRRQSSIKVNIFFEMHFCTTVPL